MGLLGMCLCLVGCLDTKVQPRLTSVEIKEMQTREFDKSYKVVYASVIDVFQELGFVIQTSDFNTGLIVAKSNVVQRENYFMGSMTMGWNVGTAHIEDFDGKVAVRVSFVHCQRESGEQGRESEYSQAIESPEYYSRFFNQLDHSVFLRQNL